MKKATDHKPGRMITRTIQQIENRRITKVERERPEACRGIAA